MRKFNANQLVLATTLVLLTAVSATAEPILRVMSFNIRYGSAGDGENSWAKRKQVVINTIEESQPHIVGTQECLQFQAEVLDEALKDYSRFGMGRDPGGSGERMEVFYRTDTLSPVETGHFWLSKTPNLPGTRAWESACNRMVTWAKFYHWETKRFVHFFNTHFDHVSEEARQNGARILLERVQTLPQSATIIVTGDFNSLAGNSVAWQTLTGGGLKDAWPRAESRHGPQTTWSGFKAPDPARDRRIDWILYRGLPSPTRCETVTYNESGRYPSDHYPVLANFDLME